MSWFKRKETKVEQAEVKPLEQSEEELMRGKLELLRKIQQVRDLRDGYVKAIKKNNEQLAENTERFREAENLIRLLTAEYLK